MYLTLNFKKFETENIISYLNDNTDTKTLTEKDGEFSQLPQQTTFGFKQILGRVFSNAFYWENPNIDSTHPIESISFLVSTSTQSQKIGDDLMVVINTKSDNFSIEGLRSSISAFNNQENKNANEFFNAILGFKLDEVFDDVTTGKYNAKCIESNGNEELDATYSVLAGFYYYAFILQYRLERTQVATDVNAANFNEELIKQKTFLLDLNRFFLTPNRSENKSIIEFADKVMDQFKLSNNIKIRSKNVELFDDLAAQKNI